MEHSNKTLALAKFLDVDPALIKNDYSQYFSVNERIIKRGKTPVQMKQTAEDLRSILDNGIQGLISSAITSSNKELRDGVYKEAKESLVPLSDRAKRWKEHRDLIRGGVGPVISRKYQAEETYLKLQADNLYVENVLYHLLLSEDSSYSISLRKAWIGEPVDDLRSDETTSDGEYLVLTDEEADDWEEDGLRNLFDEMTHEVPDFLKKYVEADKFVKENSGNRGENINGYDGTESSQELGSETFYIYRNN